MNTSLSDVLTLPALRRIVDGATFRRGESYHADGLVRRLRRNGEAIEARVRGTREYRVKLWLEKGALSHSCSCPVGQEDLFCKHCVAVALAWLTPPVANAAPNPAPKPTVTIESVRAYLLRQEKQTLADWLLEQAEQDDRLRRRLWLQAARGEARGIDLATYRAALDEAVETGGFVPYREAYGYAAGIGEVVGSFGQLLDQGYAAEVIELTEYGLAAVERALQQVDDSDGAVGEILHTLQELHLRACQKARPDPVALAERLFRWELRGAFDVFYGAAATYANVLGKEGLARYRQLAETEWARLPALKSGQREDWSSERFHLTSIMETLTRQSGDVEAVVAVKRKNLSNSYAFLQIAEEYQKADKPDAALEWAERGRKAFAMDADDRLLDFLAQEYHRRKRHDEAMQCIWEQFERRPFLEAYQKLKRHADRVGQWSGWREKSLALVRQSIKREKERTGKDPWHRPADHSELVGIFLWEKEDETAWREAQTGGCSNDLWMQMAARREHAYPEDAVPIYQKEVENLLNQKHNQAYRESVKLLRKIGALRKTLKQDAQFNSFVADVHARHKPKRNFIKLLDQARLGTQTSVSRTAS